MVRSRLTLVGKMFLALSLLFYVASVTSQSGLLLFFIGLIGGCFAVNRTFARRNARNCEILPPDNITVAEGEKSVQPWRFSNRSRKHLELIEVFSPAGLLFRIPMVRVDEVLSLSPALAYARRGVYRHNGIRVESAAPFGLVRATKTLDLPGEIVVVPRVYTANAPLVSGVDQISGGRFRGRRRVNSGTHFAGVRAWQAGDTMKQVHWNSTARRGEIMVKTFEEELGGRISVILQCSGKSEKLVDDSVRAAASVAVAALQEGHHVEYIPANDESLRLAPFSDEGELLHRLAIYEPSALSLTIDSLWRKSSLALFGDEWQPSWSALINEAQAQNRRSAIYLPEGTPVPPEVEAEVFWFSSNEIRDPVEAAK